MAYTKVNPTAQDLMTVALQQQNALQSGALVNKVGGIDTYYPRNPWIDEPDGSLSFDPQGGVALPAVGGTATVLTFTVPTGYDGVIKRISQNTVFAFNDFSGDIQWQILQNGRAIRNYDNMLAHKGSIEVPREISPIRIYSADAISYIVNHLANVALNGQVVCTMTGYFYPSKGAS